MLARLSAFALAAAPGLLALASVSVPPSPVEANRGDSLGAELRYIGRDPLTGMPARIDDRFIAESERAIERYGKDPGTPVPPPPPGPLEIANVTIERLGISAAPVGRYGLDAFGRLDVPQDTTTIGWSPAYNDLPGQGGATFFAAHYEYAGRPGVFYRLSTLRPGDSIEVTLTDGTLHRYRVTSTVEYALATIDMGALLHGREGIESITLMTCSGPANEGEYAFRTVVLAERSD